MTALPAWIRIPAMNPLRKSLVLEVPPGADGLAGHRRGWPGLRSVAMVLSERREGERVSVESRYYISSLQSDAGRLLQATRSHWGIENSVHWLLDLSFREDESRIRTGNAPENMAIVQHMALNLLRQDQKSKTSIKARRKLAGWDNGYLLSILSN